MRIYMKVPPYLQWTYLRDHLSVRQIATLTCGMCALLFLVIIFIQTRFARSQDQLTTTGAVLPNRDDTLHSTSFTNGPDVHYGIVLDCGSSGSRVYVYVWPPHSGNPRDLLNIQQLKDQYGEPVVKKVTPGLDTFADNPEDASEYIKPLLQYAGSYIPKIHHKETLLYILATAGMRMLPERSQKKILQDLQRDIPKEFDFVISDNNFEVISGKQEGVYAWIAVNYILDKFGHGDEDHPLVAVDVPSDETRRRQHVRRRTVGMIDMGGGSMQIAMEITANIDNIPKHLMAEFNLGCLTTDIGHTYRVYVTTFLGYGANEARVRYENMRIKQISDSVDKSAIRYKRDLQQIEETLSKRLSLPKKNVNQIDETLPQILSLPKTNLQQIEKRLPLPERNSSFVEHLQHIKRDQGSTKYPGKSEVVQLLDPKQQQQPASPSDPYKDIPDPCLQSGQLTKALEPDYRDKATFKGTGDYYKCKEALIPLLNLTVPCASLPCSMNGVYQPTISFNKDEFYGFSELWYTMEDVFRIGGKYDNSEFEVKAKDFCSQNWSLLEARFKKGLYKKAGKDRFMIQCFKSAWMTTVLHNGLQFPEKYDKLTSVQIINRRDVQWTLGALIHRTRYLPLRAIEKMEIANIKPSWNIGSHILYNEYIILVCFFIVVMAIILYVKRLKLCSPSSQLSGLSRVPSMSYFMTEIDQVEQGVRYSKSYTYP